MNVGKDGWDPGKFGSDRSVKGCLVSVAVKDGDVVLLEQFCQFPDGGQIGLADRWFVGDIKNFAAVTLEKVRLVAVGCQIDADFFVFVGVEAQNNRCPRWSITSVSRPKPSCNNFSVPHSDEF